MAKPLLRFKGYDERWIVYPLKELSDIVKGVQINKSELSDKGDYYVMNGGVTPSGYTNMYNSEGDTISISEGGNSCGYVYYNKDRFWSGGHNYTLQKVLLDIKCLYACLKSKEFYLMKKRIGSGLPNIQKKSLMDYEIYIPQDEKEQFSVGDFIRKIEDLEILIVDKLLKIKQMKSASLISMFPQAGETTPRVRFKGFVGEWKHVILNDVFIERHEISTITNELPQLSFSIEEGVILPENRKTNKRDFLIKDKSNKKYLVTYFDDIIYNPANVVYGAIHKNSLRNGCVSPIYKIFYTNQDASFMECVVRRQEFINEMTIYMEGTVQKLRTLKPESFLKMSAFIAPSIAEQTKIGNYFHSLDKQISLQEQRLEKLKQIKAACLDKMFV